MKDGKNNNSSYNLSNNNKHNKINFMNEVKLFNEILNSHGEILVFDFRDEKSFLLNNFSKYSINMPYNSKNISYEFCNSYDPSSWETYAKNDIEKKTVKFLKRHHIVIITSNNKIKRHFIVNIFNKLKDNKKFI